MPLFKPTVLLICQDSAIAEVLSRHLEQLDVQVVLAPENITVSHFLDRMLPDLIICDLERTDAGCLLGLNQFRLKWYDKRISIPLIFLAFDLKQIERYSIQQHDVVLLKPFKIDSAIVQIRLSLDLIKEKKRSRYSSLELQREYPRIINSPLKSKSSIEVEDQLAIVPLSQQQKSVTLDKLKNERELLSRLSKRQLEVALLVYEGKSNQEIAKSLGVSIRTIESHVSNSLSKLEIKNRVQIAQKIATARIAA